MSQFRIVSIDEVNTNGFQLATMLENFSAAVLTMQSGTTRPAGAVQGTFWIKTGSSDIQFMMYDGAQDIPVCALDITNNIAKAAGKADDWNTYIAHDPALDNVINAYAAGSLALRINNKGLAIGSNVATVGLEVQSVDAIRIPVGTTSQRPTGNVAGRFRYNTTTSALEYNDGTAWRSVGTGGGGGGTPGGSGVDEETIQDWVNDLLVDTTGATGITKTYSDTAGTLALNTVRNIPAGTGELSETGTNLYFTNERAQDAAAAMIRSTTGANGITATYNDTANTLSLTTSATVPLNTDNLSEGSNNLYHTDERARDAAAAMLRQGYAMVIQTNDAQDTTTLAVDRDVIDARARAAITADTNQIVAVNNTTGAITTNADAFGTATRAVVTQTFSKGDGIDITSGGSGTRVISVDTTRIAAIAQGAVRSGDGYINVSSGTISANFSAFQILTQGVVTVGAGLTKTVNSNGTITLNTAGGVGSGGTFASAGDTTFTSLADGDVAVYDSSDSKWKNKKLASVSLGTASVLKGTIAADAVGTSEILDSEVGPYIEGKIDGHLTGGDGISYSSGAVSLASGPIKSVYGGLNVSITNNATQITVAPGRCGAADGSRLLELASAWTGPLQDIVTGNNITIANSTWYYLHAITLDTAPNAIIVRASTDRNPSAVQTGHTYGRLIGAARSNSAVASLRGLACFGAGAVKDVAWTPTINFINGTAISLTGGKEVSSSVDISDSIVQGAGGSYGRVHVAGEWYTASGDTSFDYGGFTAEGGGGNFPLGEDSGNNFLGIVPTSSGGIRYNFSSIQGSGNPARRMTVYARVVGFEMDLAV